MSNIEQYVYVMSNSSYSEDMLLIGWSKDHPSIKAVNLQTIGIPTPFIVEFVIITQDGFQLEQTLYEHLKEYRVNINRKFFKIQKETLYNILVNELILSVKNINELESPTPTPKGWGKTTLKNLYNTIELEATPLFDKLKQPYTGLKLNIVDGKKYISLYKTNYKNDALNYTSHDENYDIKRELRRLCSTCYFLDKKIKGHKEDLDKLLNHRKEIIETIGIDLFNEDNKSFKKMMLATLQDLNKLKHKYIWQI